MNRILKKTPKDGSKLLKYIIHPWNGSRPVFKKNLKINKLGIHKIDTSIMKVKYLWTNKYFIDNLLGIRNKKIQVGQMDLCPPFCTNCWILNLGRQTCVWHFLTRLLQCLFLEACCLSTQCYCYFLPERN